MVVSRGRTQGSQGLLFSGCGVLVWEGERFGRRVHGAHALEDAFHGSPTLRTICHVMGTMWPYLQVF